MAPRIPEVCCGLRTNKPYYFSSKMSTCFAYGCNHRQGHSLCNFFRFPKEKTSLKEWTHLSRRQDTVPKPCHRLCSCHFRDGKKEYGPTLLRTNEQEKKKSLFSVSSPEKRVADEIEALQAILMDELRIKTDERGQCVGLETELHPWTALDTEQQYVRVTLQVALPPGYPDVKPEVILSSPRGIDDTLLQSINRQVAEKCSETIGQPVIFEIIEIVKEQLTASNMPSVPCCICLYGFREGDQFTKTHCYHYFHSLCLAGHLTASENSFKEEQDKLPPWQRTESFQIADVEKSRLVLSGDFGLLDRLPASLRELVYSKAVCPVCRAEIDYDVETLKSALPPRELEEAPVFQPTPELRRLQESMSRLYLKQRSKGGIITPSNKTLLLSKAMVKGLTDDKALSGFMYSTSSAQEVHLLTQYDAETRGLARRSVGRLRLIRKH